MALGQATNEQDILDRLEVRQVLEGFRRDASEDSDTFYLLEVAGASQVFEGAMYGVWQMLPHIHSQIGFSYRDEAYPFPPQSFLKAYCLAMLRTFTFQPLLGVGAAYGLLDREGPRFLTEAFMGARIQLSRTFAFSLKQGLRLSDLSFQQSEGSSLYRAAEKTFEIAFQVQL